MPTKRLLNVKHLTWFEMGKLIKPSRICAIWCQIGAGVEQSSPKEEYPRDIKQLSFKPREFLCAIRDTKVYKGDHFAGTTVR